MSKIGALGPSGTFSEFALQTLLSHTDYEYSHSVLFNSIACVFESLTIGKVDKIVVPIENTINGKVESTLDELLRLNAYHIEFEFIVPISHCLLGKSLTVMDSVSYILSHYQPLGQCQNYLLKQFPEATHIVTESSAFAAEFLSSGQRDKFVTLPYGCSSDNTVVIGSQSLASLYNLSVLDADINDVSNNFTRFLVIGNQLTELTGNDKTSLVFTTPNHSGALYEILGIFADADINLLSIASRPSKKKLGEYLFYVDVSGHRDEDQLKTVLLAVEQKASFYKFLGSFSLAGAPLC